MAGCFGIEGCSLQAVPKSTRSGRNRQVFQTFLEALREYSHTFVYLDRIEPTIAALKSGDISQIGLPLDFDPTPVVLSSIRSNTTLRRFTFYIVNGDVDLGNAKTVSDLIIFSTGNINLGSNLNLDRVYLVAEGNINASSNNRVGRTSLDFCATGIYSTTLLARGTIAFNSNNELRDVLMASRGTINLGSNNVVMDGVLAEALGAFSAGNAQRAAVCRNGLVTDLGVLEAAGAGGSNLVR